MCGSRPLLAGHTAEWSTMAGAGATSRWNGMSADLRMPALSR
jgi:hypothetical protein